jgi:hypothetical protein
MRSAIVFVATLFVSGTALALDAVGQRYVEQLTQGGMGSVKSAAQSMYNTSETNTEVLDVAAEVLLRNYANGADADALAWVAKALGRSHNGRYYGVLKEVADSSPDKKVRKYAQAAQKELGSASGDQYVRGTANLAAARDGKTPAASQKAKKTAASAPAESPARTLSGLDVIRKGMSMQEAYDLVGPPTSSSSRATGKAWIPFNYRGADLVRSYALYKGKGRIVFSTSSRYDHTMRVIEVQIDPNERGYP